MRYLAPALMALMFMPGAAFAQGKPAAGKGPQVVPVVVSSAYTDNFVDKVEAIGTLRANESITLASTVTETLTAVNFTDNQRVKKGDILVEITSSEEKALLDQQLALVTEAGKQLERAKELSKGGAVSSLTLDERQRDYSSAKAGLAALQSRLQDHIIVAPFDGVVGLRNLSVGALVQPGTKITTLDDDSVMKLDFSVPAVFLPALKPGVEITARASGFNEDFKGEVSAIDSQIDEVTRSVIVRAMIPNPDFILKPGLLMTVDLLKNPRVAVAVPETAIVPEGNKQFVFVVDPSSKPPTAEKREVSVGTRREGDLEVKDKLKAGEKVIVQGTMMVRDGSAVNILTEQARGESLHDLLKRLDPKQPADKDQAAKGK